MGKENKNKRKAAALAVGAMMAVAGGAAADATATPSRTPEAEAHEVVTAADAVIIDGVRVEYGELLASTRNPKAKMYGPPATVYGPPPGKDRLKPSDKIHLMYGPPVKPPVLRDDVIENYISSPEELQTFDRLRAIFNTYVEEVRDMSDVDLYKKKLTDFTIDGETAKNIVAAINDVFGFRGHDVDIDSFDFSGNETFGDLTRVIYDMDKNLGNEPDVAPDIEKDVVE